MSGQHCQACGSSTDANLCASCTGKLRTELLTLNARLADLQINATREDNLAGAGASTYSTRRHQIPAEGVTATLQPDPTSTSGARIWVDVPDQALPAHLRAKSGRVSLPSTPWGLGWDASNTLAEIRRELRRWHREATHRTKTHPRRTVGDPGPVTRHAVTTSSYRGPVCRSEDCRHESCTTIRRTRRTTVVTTDTQLCLAVIGALNQIRHLPDAGEILTAVATLTREATDAVDRRAPEIYAGPCDEPDVRVVGERRIGPVCAGFIDCGHESCNEIYEERLVLRPVPSMCGVPLYVRAGDDVVKCGACGAEYAADERRRVLLEQSRDKIAPTAWIADMLSTWQEEISASAIRQMARDKLITARGVDADRSKLYRCGDVMAVLEARRLAREVRAGRRQGRKQAG